MNLDIIEKKDKENERELSKHKDGERKRHFR